MADRTTDPDSTVDHDTPDAVSVVGEDIVVVPLPDRETDDDSDGGDEEALPSSTLETGFSCDTGTTASGEWRGVPLPALLDRATLPEDTTHLVLRAPDGFQVCVPVTTALNGVVATTLDGERIDDARTRFVAPGLTSTRCIRDVATIEAVSLAPNEDRSDYESIGD